MVGNDDSLVVVSLSSLNHVAHAVVYGVYSLCNGVVDASVSHHVAVGKVYHDKVILLCVDGSHQFVFHLICAHFGLQVVCCHAW